MFLHGWGGGVVSFLSVAERLRGINCLLFDFRGFGKSAENGVYTLEDYARDTLALMDEVGIKKAVLVGHSFGCRVAAYLAANHPDRVAGLVITDGAGLKPRRGLKYYYKILIYKLKKKLGLDTKGAGSEDYRSLNENMKRTFVNVVNRYTDEECARINCPALVVWGKEDKDTPLYMAKRFERLIKDSALIMLDGGHFCYLENLSVYVAILGKFIAGVCDGVVCGCA